MAMSLNTKRVIVFLLGLALCVALILVADQERRRHTPAGRPAPIVTAENAPCVDCHGLEKPSDATGASAGVVAQWKASRHAVKGVGCLDCHRGYDEDADGTRTLHPDSWLHEGVWISSIVTPRDCQSCHPNETAENMASRHSSAAMFIGSLDNHLGEFVTGSPNAVLGCKQCHGSRVKLRKHFRDGTTFVLDMTEVSEAAQAALLGRGLALEKQPVAFKQAFQEEMARRVAAAWQPHHRKTPLEGRKGIDLDKDTWPNSGMGRFNPDGSIGSCNACHSRHIFSKALARQPDNCGKCHMGPDHPQIEIYNESKHGIAFRNRLAEMNLDGDPHTGQWIVGQHYHDAPTCATCHMSAGPGLAVSHDPGLRLSWTLRPLLSERTDSTSATIRSGRLVVTTHPADAKRETMKRICSVCHGPTHIENFYQQYDALVKLYNEKFALPAQALMGMLQARGYVDVQKPLASEVEWVFYELWHHEGRRMRMGASMMGPDYTHWHGAYEVAKHFYFKFLPAVRKLAAAHQDAELHQAVDELLARPDHKWIHGLSKEERLKMIRFYEERYGQPTVILQTQTRPEK